MICLINFLFSYGLSPHALKDIPPWRRLQITWDILWFSRYSPTGILEHIDREWAEIQDFVAKCDFQ